MIEINGSNLGVDIFCNVVLRNEKITLSNESIKKVKKARTYIEEVIDSEVPTYGVNTGFGKLSDVSINKCDVSTLQINLLKSHACGVGTPFEPVVVRGMLLLRINALIKGYSGIRLCVIEKMIEFLNKGLIPVVFSQGSLGASGDLAPLSHMSLPLVGLGEVFYKGERLTAKEGLEKANIQPIDRLQAKEGLCLINGTQAMTAVAALAIKDAAKLLKLSEYALALSMEALHGIKDVFFHGIHRLRNQTGQIEVAEDLEKILHDSKLVTKQGEKRIQDGYSLRCSPQVIGASLDTINYCQDIIEKEMNAVTDNPIVFADEKRVVSAGNFHGQPIAFAMDFLAIAVAELANISERRLERMVNASLSNGLPAFLVKQPGINSGFMIVQYSAASLVSENKVLCHPASVDSIPSSANQEDHVSMGTIAARKARDVIKNAKRVLTMEILTALQALDFRQTSLMSTKTKAIYDYIRKEINFVDQDTVMYHLIHHLEVLVDKPEFDQLMVLESE